MDFDTRIHAIQFLGDLAQITLLATFICLLVAGCVSFITLPIVIAYKAFKGKL